MDVGKLLRSSDQTWIWLKPKHFMKSNVWIINAGLSPGRHRERILLLDYYLVKYQWVIERNRTVAKQNSDQTKHDERNAPDWGPRRREIN